MRLLVAILNLAVTVSAAQVGSFNDRRIEYCSAPGRAWGIAVSGTYDQAADNPFGRRTIEVANLRSSREVGYFDTENSAQGGAASYVAEAGGALVGGVLIGVGAAAAGGALMAAVIAAVPPSEGEAGAYLAGGLVLVASAGGAVLGYPAGCAMGTATVGRWRNRGGNTGLAYAGAYIGLLAAVPVAITGVGVVIAPLLPPAGAVIGYNMPGRGEEPISPMGARVYPPTVAFSIQRGSDSLTCPALDCQLFTLRF